MSATVDVIVATNRVGPFLAEALRSVAAQDWPDWRVTIVDDGVPEAGFVQQVAGHFPGTHVLRQPHRGPSAARNAGVEATSAPLLVFLDDDDVWRSDRLRLQARDLLARPGAVASYTGGWYMDSEGRSLGTGWSAHAATAGQFRQLSVELPRITTLMVTREAFESAGGFVARYTSSEDIDLALKLVGSGAVLPLNEPLVGYRRHRHNVTSTTAHVTLAKVQERVFSDNVAAALARDDTEAARDLRIGRRRVRARAARDAAHRCAHAMAGGDVTTALTDLLWSTSRSPASVAAGAGERILAQARRRLSGRPGPSASESNRSVGRA